jgi:hypothetical protein
MKDKITLNITVLTISDTRTQETDKSGNLIEFTTENIQDIKAQLAYNSFNTLIDTQSLKETVNESIDGSIKEIVNEISNSGGFDIDEFLNQDFSITLDNYSQLVGSSFGIDTDFSLTSR